MSYAPECRTWWSKGSRISLEWAVCLPILHWQRWADRNEPASGIPYRPVAKHSNYTLSRNKHSRAYREWFDAPNEHVLLGNITHAAHRSFKFGRIGIGRHGHHNFHVIGRRAALELRPSLDHVLDPRVGVPFDHGCDPNQRFYLKTHPLIQHVC